ncbi:Hypothetical protein, putative [Bodo saltans]|uniref:Uncharacterized protein n=1 Tax=Bodo saltans TaxID=75058 RepID=A0A0S4IW25_BODSA|nr:Hypothetical protein, putative [Bodo saltans]|eukprot:CUF69715.1 Hypothetical protein, putative [Bodo saltans]
MPSSHQAKLEERETRKLLAAARVAKKEAAKKQRKHGGKKVAQEEKKRYVPKSVLVLKSDLAIEAAAPAEKAQAGSAKKKGRNSTGRASQTLERPDNSIEPSYNFEVHHKNKQVLVSVHLNKVPPQSINVDATTATTFVVQTPKFTKKYYLAFELPSGIKIDPKAADYTFDTGVLKCILPIVGDLPQDVVAERAALVEKFKEQKALRFRMSKEGELVVRSRRALLKKNEPATQTGAADKKPEAPKKTAEKKAVLPKEAKKAPAPTPKQASVSTNKSKQFVADGSAMLAVAAASGKQQRNQLYAKLEKAKEVQMQRCARLSKRDGRKDVKREKNEATFARVIAEQKAQMLQRAEIRFGRGRFFRQLRFFHSKRINSTHSLSTLF